MIPGALSLAGGPALAGTADSERDRLLAKAEASVAAATSRATEDPTRPIFHFLPPAYWMNDPNGPIFFGGYYHMFYQFNPYGDDWGNMHWGHARSKDLAHWERLPIALWPSKEKGEEHCFSGSAAIDSDGRLRLFYTSIGARAPEQWMAVSTDADALGFEKFAANPVLKLSDHQGAEIDEWRDPFIFRENNVWYLVAGGHQKGRKGCIELYSSADLTTWKYLGIPIEGKEANWECPNLFRLGDRWVLVYSPHGPVRFMSGKLDLAAVKFTPEREGTVDPGHYYAPNGLETKDGRRIMWGWVNGFKPGRGWNGCLTLPRVLSLGGAGELIQLPAPELASLRGERIAIAPRPLAEGKTALAELKGNAIELELSINLETAASAGIELEGGARIAFDGRSLEVAGVKVDTPPSKAISLHVFIDRSVLEVYAASGAVCVTRVIAAPKPDSPVRAFAAGGSARISSGAAWPIAPIFEPGR